MLQIIINSFIDHIPLWVWLTIAGCGIGAALWFLSPVLLPIWRMIPLSGRVAIIGALAAAFAYLGGRYRGRANADEEARRRNAEALKKRVEVERDTASKTDKQVHSELDRWRTDD